MRLVCLVILLALSETCEASGVGATPERVALRAIAEAYRDNRERFAFLTCRFLIREGKAASLEEALAGSFEPTLSAEGLWIVRGRNVRFEIRVLTGLDWASAAKGAEGVETNEGGQGIVVVPMLSTKVLDNGLYQLRLCPEVNTGNIFSPVFPPRGIEMTPFDMGVMGADESLSPPALIDRALLGKGFCSVSSQQLGEVVYYTLDYGDSPGSVGLRFVLDSGKGFLPREVWLFEQSTGQALSTLFVTKCAKHSNGAWAPERGINVWNRGEPPLSVREFQVLDLNVRDRPADQDFVIHAPAGLFINDPATLGAQARVAKQGLAFSLSDLSGLRERIRGSALLGDAPPVTRPSRWTSILLANALVVALAYLVFMGLRRWRNAARTR